MDKSSPDSPENKRRREAYSRALQGNKGGHLGEKLSQAYFSAKQDSELLASIDESESERNKGVIFNKPFPKDKRTAFLGAAESLADAGINTPEALAAGLESRFGQKLRPFTQTLWNFISGFDETASKTPTPDWGAIYASAEISSRIDRETDSGSSAGDEDLTIKRRSKEDCYRLIREGKAGQLGKKLSKAYSASTTTKSSQEPDSINTSSTEQKGKRVYSADSLRRTAKQSLKEMMKIRKETIE